MQVHNRQIARGVAWPAEAGLLLACLAAGCGAAGFDAGAAGSANLRGGPTTEEAARQSAWQAAERLAPDPKLKDAFAAKVVTMLAHRDAGRRAASAADLGALARPAADIPLRQALRDPDRAVRSAAAKALGACGDSNAASALSAAMGDASPGVRVAAAGAIGEIASRTAASGVASRRGAIDQAAGALTELLNDPEPLARAEAAASLGRLKEAGAATALARLVSSDADAQVRAAAATAIGRLASPPGAAGPPAASEGSSATTQTPAAASRPAAAHDAVAVLIKALGDDSAMVRHAAVGALGAICAGDGGATPEIRAVTTALAARLKDRHAAVRAAAAFTIGRVADPASEAALAEAARTDPDEAVRDAATDALAEINRKKSGEGANTGPAAQSR
jgi:HEAT repeat protein